MKKNICFCFLALFCYFGAQATTASFITERNCVNEKTTLTSTSTSKDSIDYFQWDLNGDMVYNDASGRIIYYQFPGIGSYDVGLRIITDVGDTVTVRKQVIIFGKPTGNFSVSQNCSLDSTLFTDMSSISSGTISNYLWIFGDGSSKYFKTSPKYRYNQAGTYNVTLITISDMGCEDTFTKTIEIFPTPVVILTVFEDSIFYEDDSAEISVQGDYTSYLWSTGDTLSKIMVKEQGIYDVAVVDSNNCPSSASMIITVIPKKSLKFVDVITPNNDGINDVFQVLDKEGYRQVKINIYNRYGVEVYAAEDYVNDWGGTYNGELLPEGTYFYVVEIIDWNSDRNTVYKGALSVIY